MDLHIVVYRRKNKQRWESFSDGAFIEARLADNFAECKVASGWTPDTWELAVVSGPAVTFAPVLTKQHIDMEA